MNIANNILKHSLKNVYFLAGTACGGKTTMSKIIAEKYGFYLFDENNFFDEHRKIANEIEQPSMTKKFPDWEYYFNRPPVEYSEWLSDSGAEELEMSLIDLIVLSHNQKVIVDIHVKPEVAITFTEYNRIAFLVAEPELVMKDYYDRDGHREIYDCIMGLSNPEKTLENVNNMFIYGTNKMLDSIYSSGLYYIKRDNDSTVDKTLALLESHFGLCAV